MHYDPDALLLTAVEFDHADIYRDLAHVKGAFTTLLQRTRRDAPVVASADFAEARAVALRAAGRSSSSGRPRRRLAAEDVVDGGAATRFTIVTPERRRLAAACRAPGLMNVVNALGVTALATAIGVPLEGALAAIESFRGVGGARK